MDGQVIYKGFSEFAEALGVAAADIEQVFMEAAYATARAIRTTAQERVPKRSYVLMNSIIAEAIPGGAQTTVMEIYGTYLEYGTGLFGPKHEIIRPKNGKVMAWRASTGEMIFARSTKGMRAQPFWNKSVDDNMVTLEQSLKVGLDTIIATLAGGK